MRGHVHTQSAADCRIRQNSTEFDVIRQKVSERVGYCQFLVGFRLISSDLLCRVFHRDILTVTGLVPLQNFRFAIDIKFIGSISFFTGLGSYLLLIKAGVDM